MNIPLAVENGWEVGGVGERGTGVGWARGDIELPRARWEPAVEMERGCGVCGCLDGWLAAG